MTTVRKILDWIVVLAPVIFLTLAFYHAFRAVPVGGGYVVATNAFQAIFYILVAIFLKVSPWSR